MRADLGVVASLQAVAGSRRRLAAQLEDWGMSDIADDAALVLSELVTNAVLHGDWPVRVRVERTDVGVRVEVQDGAARAPDPRHAGPDDTIGRGMCVVEALGDSWGWHPTADGKIVWCEVRSVAPSAAATSPAATADAASRAADGVPRPADGATGEGAAGDQDRRRWRVRVPDVPVQLLADHVMHVEGQLRELRLVRDGGPGVLAGLGPRLERILREYGSRPSLLVQLRAAQAAGRTSFELALDLPLSTVQRCRAYLEVLDEVDAYCRAEHLLALESPPALRGLRRWLLGELSSGVLRAAGRAAPPPGDQLAQLQRVAIALAGSDTLHAAADVLVRELPTLFDALRTGVFVISEDGEALIAVNRSSWGEADVHERYALPLATDWPSTTAARTGEFLEIVGREEMARRFPRVEQDTRLPDEEQAWRLVPLRVDGVPIGLIAVTATEPVPLRGDERRLLEALADHAAVAVRRAQRFEREQRIVQALQSSLLDEIASEIAGLDVAIRYQPAQSHQMVGGDWHDVFELAPGVVGVTVGDVCGHGAEAAAVMGRVRSALAAIAQDEPSPGTVLAKVNRMLCRLGDAALGAHPRRSRAVEPLATALYGRLDLRSRTFVYAVAGHPGPVVTDLDAPCARLDHPVPNLPLGVEPFSAYREQVLELPARGSLLAFTDGLFERRDELLDASLGALVARVRELAGRPVEELADALLDRAATDTRSSDDVALVVLGW